MSRKQPATNLLTTVLSARNVFIIMGICLVLFVVSIVMTTIADDTVGADRVNDIATLATRINDGDVTEINQRNGIQMVIGLKNGEKLIYYRPANSDMTSLLKGAGITDDQLTAIQFTTGASSSTIGTLGSLLRIIGLGGLGIVVIFGYYVRRVQVMGGQR